MSTSSRENRILASIGKTRRSPPGDAQGSVFFTGQGGRTVLPPLSSAFPTSRFPVPNTYTTPYTQPRSSPGRYDLNPQVFYGSWPSGNTSPQLAAAYPNYEATDRYSTLSNYTTTAYPSRTSSPVGTSPGDSRRLPPIPATTNVERWQQASYMAPSSNYQAGVRTPTTTNYPAAYPNYTTNSQTSTYSYHIPTQEHPSHSHLTAMPTTSHATIYDEIDPQRTEPRPASPYNRSASHVAQSTFMPSSVSPTGTTTEEPTIKKKRKRADANQLKVLNETYNRTAFPSTEERLALAKLLDMSPRSVQIWFQNKRQSMRQTNRQSSSASSAAHQSFSAVAPGEGLLDDMGHPSSAYGGGPMPMTDVPYLTAAPQESSRSHTPHSPSSHHRIRGQEDSEPRKWPRGY
ncbi:hypothetical protein AX17_001473 [Amanita inopinata Kibby_2008]|nr:hypothetical protein AX17_001473 [Amanita inopinata Kibby_2008]